MAKGSYLKKHLNKGGVTSGSRKRVEIGESLRNFYLDGQIILIDKPMHWTSFDVVKKVRGALQIKKVGHAGTLDPLATGLLIVCTGKQTKQIQYIMKDTKVYTATFTLGASTPTYDLESEPENFRTTEGITGQDIELILKQFRGEIMQRPPVFSAIKKEGKAAYELARRGEDFELEPRPITIYSLDILEVKIPELRVRIECSTGTYIRSLAHDIGEALGCGAYLSALRRTHIGTYRVEDAVTPEQFLEMLEVRNADLISKSDGQQDGC